MTYISQHIRVLVLSEPISDRQRRTETRYSPPYDIDFAIGDLNQTEGFAFSVFDYDISVIHIIPPRHHTIGYYNNLPKLLHDAELALVNGRTIICLPESDNFISERTSARGMTAYAWLNQLGVKLQDNVGGDIKPSGAGRSIVIQKYLECAPTYYQIVKEPQPSLQSTLAVVDDTNIVVGLQHMLGPGTLVILPPPSPSSLHSEQYFTTMSRIMDIARFYYEHAQRRIPVGDAPQWLEPYLVQRAKELAQQIETLNAEKAKYDNIAYVLYGTGEELEECVTLLLRELGLAVERQPKGANIDLKAKHAGLGLGFAIEVTGTKSTIQKDSNKLSQAWQHISDRAGTPEENDRLIIVANTQSHLDPKQRSRDSFSQHAVDLLSRNDVLMITTVQLYELWKSVQEGNMGAEEAVKRLYDSTGLYR